MKSKFRCQMCGECCRRYVIPVSLSDIERISEFTRMNPTRFLHLIAPDKSTAHTYYDIPKIEFRGEKNNVLALKDANDACIFLEDGKCRIYNCRPLRCRPFPYVYERQGGRITFSINVESASFCRGLNQESGEIDISKLSKAVTEMETEQEALRAKVGEWNARMANHEGPFRTLSDLLKFLLPNTR